jgi:glycolate oxidase FAD binding subunit
LNTSVSFDSSLQLPLLTASSVGELGDIVRRAALEKKAVYPLGGRTMLDLGLAPTKPGVAIDLRRLDQVIDYPARDMTITVQAGITIAKLQSILHAERQQLPVDVPLPEQATLGGAIATNASGPRRFEMGTLRDYVIGISVVNDLGEEIKAGGRVVKNVAGYDLMKLYTGSLGTLGVITQVTLKLKPLPEASALLVIPVSLGDAATILDGFVTSRTRPVCIELLDPEASRLIGGRQSIEALAPGWNVIIGFEDNAAAVKWQADQLKRELPVHLQSKVRECSNVEAEELWHRLRDFALWPEDELSFKASLLSSGVIDFCRQAVDRLPGPLLQAHAGSGIIGGHCSGLTMEQVPSMLKMLGAIAQKSQGNLVVTRCPPAWKAVLPIWGRSTGDREVMKTIKERLDPANIFNPGRFVDGI